MRFILLLLISASTFLAVGLLNKAIHVRAVTESQLSPDSPRLDLSRPNAPHSFRLPLPRTGDQKLLILLVDFPDRAGLFSGQSWQQRFFGSEGLADYYREVSYQQLRYSGDVVGIAAGTPVTNSNEVAYIRLSQPLTYYADGSYGFVVGPQQFPKNNGGVTYHALQALDNAGFDFSPYANPTSNEVENLVVVFAGSSYAATRDPVNTLEATAYNLQDAGLGSTYISSGGQQFNNYTFCPDQRQNLGGKPGYLGICAHEHGHGLGMPDLYDYSYTTSGAGKFDLMAYGNAYSDFPFHFGGFSKEFYGWITPTLLLTGTYHLSLTPTESGANLIKLFPNGDSNAQEYFLLENRQPIGFDREWSTQSLCAGLVIWHVDRSIVENPSAFFAVNARPPYVGAPAHPGVSVVEADGNAAMINTPIDYGECADLWQPGRTWDATSTPPATLWDGQSSGLSVTVEQADGTDLLLAISVGDGISSEPKRVFLPLVGR